MSGLDPNRRVQLVALLEERARLLALKPGLVEEALARCHPRTGTARTRRAARTRGQERTSALGAPVLEASTPGEGRPPTTIGSARLAEITSTASGTGGDATARTVADSVADQLPITVGDTIPNGRIIAGYRIDGMLGKGGMGQVYRALQLSVQRPVAFKVLSRRLAADPSFRERFLREARAAGRLHHHHLITVHDVGEADGLMFFSMELVEGGTVRDLVARGPIAPERAIDIAIQALSALSYAHEHGIVHRDIKPDNIMVTPAGVVKVADLGLSLIADSGSRALDSTQAGTLMGTPHYMPPEQSRDAHTVDERSDLYALGATLYHMVIGRPPFTGKNPVEVVMKAATDPLTFPDPPPDPELREVLERLLAKRPEDRYPSAAAAIAALERLQGGAAARPGRTQRRRALRARRLRRLHLGRTLAIGAALVAAVAVLWLCLPRERHLDAEEGGRLGALIDQGRYQDALAAIDEDMPRERAGSQAAAELQVLRDKAASAWNQASMERVSAAFKQYNAAVVAHDLKAARMALSLDDEASLSPEARKALDTQRDTFEDQLTALANAGAGVADDPEAKAARDRERQAYMAGLLWGRFRPEKHTTIQAIDAGISFGGSGRGWLGLGPLGTERAALPALLMGGLRFELKLAAADKDAQIQLTLMSARVVASNAAVILTIANQERARAPAGTAVRLRLRNRQLEMALGDGAWTDVALAPNYAALAISWQLGAAGKAQVVSAFENI